MNISTKLLAPIASLLLAHQLSADASPSAVEILRKTEKVYADCASYADTGYVRTVFLKKNGARHFVTKKVFNTLFVRPDKFRFEYAEKVADELQRAYIILKNGRELKTFWELTGEKTPESLSLAIAAATGVSSGTAHNIPALLLSEVRGGKITGMRNPIIIGEKKDDDGKECYLIKAAKDKKNRTFILWVRKSTFLISKIEATVKFAKFDAKNVTVYHPVINAEIPDSDFKLRKKDSSAHGRAVE